MRFAKEQGAIIELLLNFRQQGFQPLLEAFLGYKRLALLAWLIATSDADSPFLDVLGSNLHAHGNAFQLPFVEFVAGTVLLAVVYFKAQSAFPIGTEARNGLQHSCALGIGLENWNDDDLRRRNARRHDQAFVVGMGHDERADETSAHAPTRGPSVLHLVILVGIGNVE